MSNPLTPSSSELLQGLGLYAAAIGSVAGAILVAVRRRTRR
jgi:hypothetical protein